MTREMAELRAAWLAEEAARVEFDQTHEANIAAHEKLDKAKRRAAAALIALRDSCVAEARSARAQLNTLPERS